MVPTFSKVVGDFAGPLSVLVVGPSDNRGKVIFKSFVSIFVCTVTRAVHLEVVETLPQRLLRMHFPILFYNVYSDSGSNFVGPDCELHLAFELPTRKIVVKSKIRRGSLAFLGVLSQAGPVPFWRTLRGGNQVIQRPF